MPRSWTQRTQLRRSTPLASIRGTGGAKLLTVRSRWHTLWGCAECGGGRDEMLARLTRIHPAITTLLSPVLPIRGSVLVGQRQPVDRCDDWHQSSSSMEQRPDKPTPPRAMTCIEARGAAVWGAHGE